MALIPSSCTQVNTYDRLCKEAVGEKRAEREEKRAEDLRSSSPHRQQRCSSGLSCAIQ
jgi:hypothetical protein